MFCPNCQDEFRAGIAKCPDCDMDLVDELPGESPPRLSILEVTSVPERLGFLLDQLEKAQVPYVTEAGTALSLLDKDLPELSAPAEWEARVLVPGSLAARAAAVIAQAAAPSADGEPEELETLDAADLKNPIQPR